MAKRTTKVAKPRASQRRKGLRPGEYRKRSTVFVERLRSSDEQAQYITDDMYTTDAYIVISHREDGQWTHTVELRGEMMRLPGKVIERIENQKAAIIKEQRSDRAKERHEILVAQAQADQDEAEAERAADLKGL
tara:strand:- start:55 stop:456 length:402 start_codon:yes stop_codon:yes gene_type:complete